MMGEKGGGLYREDELLRKIERRRFKEDLLDSLGLKGETDLEKAPMRNNKAAPTGEVVEGTENVRAGGAEHGKGL